MSSGIPCSVASSALGTATTCPGLCLIVRNDVNVFEVSGMGLVVNSRSLVFGKHMYCSMFAHASLRGLVVAPAGLRKCVPVDDAKVLTHVQFSFIISALCFLYILGGSSVCNPASFGLGPCIVKVLCGSSMVALIVWRWWATRENQNSFGMWSARCGFFNGLVVSFRCC